MADCNIADATHFFCMGADEGTYFNVEKTVEYNLVLTRLNINGEPCTLLDWFKELWRVAKDSSTNGGEEFILSSLKIPNMLYVHMIWNTFNEESLGQLEVTPVNDNESLIAFFKKNLLCERGKDFNPNAVYVRSTAEFDYEYAFFKPAALANNELGEYMSKYVKISETTGEVEATQSKVRWDAYL